MKKPTRTVSAKRPPLRPEDLAAVRGGFFGAVRELVTHTISYTDEVNSTEYADEWSTSV